MVHINDCQKDFGSQKIAIALTPYNIQKLEISALINAMSEYVAAILAKQSS